MPRGVGLALVVVLAATAAGARVIVVNPAALAAGDDGPGSAERPFATLARAAAVVEPGDEVRIHAGTYREAVVIERSGTVDQPIRFAAAPGEVVVVTGADRLTELRPEPAADGERVYSAPWPHRFIGWSPTGTHPADDRHRLIGRAEQVFVNGYALHQVLSREQLGRGSFYADLADQRLYLHAADNAALDEGRDRDEASTRGTLWDVRGDYVQTAGLRFRYGAVQAQSALARLSGRGCGFSDCVFEYSNSAGGDFRGPEQHAIRCVFQHNGQDGFAAGEAHGLRLSDCRIQNNNTKNFNRGWGGGAFKIVLSRGVILERCMSIENRGTGMWFDIGNEDCTVRWCLIADCEDAGLFYEISYRLHAHDNVILGCGLDSAPGAWGANGGISLSSSPGCLVERNLIVGCREGIQFREQSRTTPLIDRREPEVWIWNHDQQVRCNLLVSNRDAQLWGWFDTPDQRHLPERLRDAEARGRQRPAADIAAAYQATGRDDAPAGLSLETLRLTIADNLFAGVPALGLLGWGCAWDQPRRYATPQAARDELGFALGSSIEPPPFANPAARDFRLPADHPVLNGPCYPRGDVPGVRLGALADEP